MYPNRLIRYSAPFLKRPVRIPDLTGAVCLHRIMKTEQE